MNDNDLKNIFKEASPQLSEDFTNLLMRKIEKQKARAVAFDFKYIKLVNYAISIIVVISMIVYYYIKPESNSYFNQIITEAFSKFNNVFSSININDQTAKIMFGITALMLVGFVLDRIIGQMFNKKKISK